MQVEQFSLELTKALIEDHIGVEGPLLPILHAVQETFGYVPEAAVPVIASELNLSRAEVHGVVTFYHDFRSHPAGQHIIKMCRAEACQAMGGEALVAKAEQKLGVSCGHSAVDGQVTLEPIYCLGLCATAPAAMVDGKLVGRLTSAKLDQILAEVNA